MASDVETLAGIPPLFAERHDGPHHRRRGGTRLVGLSGPVNCPGVVEVSSRVTLRELVFDVAAGLRDRRSLKGVRVAGPSGVVLGADSLDASLESLVALSARPCGLIPIPDGDGEGLTPSPK